MSHFNMFYFAIVLFMYVSYVIFQLGKFTPTKTNEFSEKFQTAIPLAFLENHIADFATKVHMIIMAGP